jgi:hypothetical protein
MANFEMARAFADSHGYCVVLHATLQDIAHREQLQCMPEAVHAATYSRKAKVSVGGWSLDPWVAEMCRGMVNLCFAYRGKGRVWVGKNKVIYSTYPLTFHRTEIKCVEIFRHAIRSYGLKQWMVDAFKRFVVVNDYRSRDECLFSELINLSVAFCFMTRFGRAMVCAPFAGMNVIFATGCSMVNNRVPSLPSCLKEGWERFGSLEFLRNEALALLEEEEMSEVTPEMTGSEILECVKRIRAD